MASRTPGVYLEIGAAAPAPALETGVPAFAGRLSAEGAKAPPFAGGASVVSLDAAGFAPLDAGERPTWAAGVLGFAVRGFFENGGRRCYVAPVGADGLAGALTALQALDDFDLLCAPDSAGNAAELAALLAFSEARRGCFALLDARGDRVAAPALSAGALLEDAAAIRRLADPGHLANGALYAPWIKVRGACPACRGAGCTTCAQTGQGFVPPSGHVAGVVARLDQRTGVHDAPANELLEGALDLQLSADGPVLAALNEAGVDCVRGLPGRGIRVYGVRTLATAEEFRYVNVRRTFLTISRWIERMMLDETFEPNDLRLWMRVTRRLNAFLDGLHRAGALFGASADDAFAVKCDAETNGERDRNAGVMRAEVRLALARPNEFVNVRITATPGGVRAEATA